MAVAASVFSLALQFDEDLVCKQTQKVDFSNAIYFRRGLNVFSCDNQQLDTKGGFFWAYSRIGIVGISQTIVRSRATLIPEWL